MISDFMVSLGFTSIRAVCMCECKRGKFESCESNFFFSSFAVGSLLL